MPIAFQIRDIRNNVTDSQTVPLRRILSPLTASLQKGNLCHILCRFILFDNAAKPIEKSVQVPLDLQADWLASDMFPPL